MKRLILALLLALSFAPLAQAQTIAFEFPFEPGFGTGLYVRIFTSTTTSKYFALAEGTSGAVGNYYITNATIYNSGSGLAVAGKYSYKIFKGATPSGTASDEEVAHGQLFWNGTEAYDPSAIQLSKLDVSAPPIAYVPKTGSKKTRFSFVVTDATGALADPAANTISLTYVDPDGGSVPVGLPATATRSATGRYYADITAASTVSTQQKLVITATATVGGLSKTTVFNTQFMATPPAQIIVQ